MQGSGYGLCRKCRKTLLAETIQEFEHESRIFSDNAEFFDMDNDENSAEMRIIKQTGKIRGIPI